MWKMQLDEELSKEKAQAAENIRRRHNYVPLIVGIMHALAAEGRFINI